MRRRFLPLPAVALAVLLTATAATADPIDEPEPDPHGVDPMVGQPVPAAARPMALPAVPAPTAAAQAAATAATATTAATAATPPFAAPAPAPRPVDSDNGPSGAVFNPFSSTPPHHDAAPASDDADWLPTALIGALGVAALAFALRRLR